MQHASRCPHGAHWPLPICYSSWACFYGFAPNLWSEEDKYSSLNELFCVFLHWHPIHQGPLVEDSEIESREREHKREENEEKVRERETEPDRERGRVTRIRTNYPIIYQRSTEPSLVWAAGFLQSSHLIMEKYSIQLITVTRDNILGRVEFKEENTTCFGSPNESRISQGQGLN